MRAATRWLVSAAVVLAACGGSSDGGGGDPTEAPTIAISDVAVGAAGAALLEYAFSDDGLIRVEIDWGDGSPLQGFTGESGSFTSRHVYDAEVTSVVVTIVTIDADGNSSAATRTVDLVAADTTEVSTAPTAPETTAAASTVPETTTPPTTPPPPTTTLPPPPPPPPDPTTTTSTTTTTTTTTTTPPRSYQVEVRGDVVRVIGDCDALGQGDFVIAGAFDTDRSAPASFSIGRVSNTEQLGNGETRNISSTISRTGPVTDGQVTEWEAFFTATEYDPIQQPDPDMNARTASADGTISSARSPISQTLSVGSGSCRVDMTVRVTSEFVD